MRQRETMDNLNKSKICSMITMDDGTVFYSTSSISEITSRIKDLGYALITKIWFDGAKKLALFPSAIKVIQEVSECEREENVEIRILEERFFV